MRFIRDSGTPCGVPFPRCGRRAGREISLPEIFRQADNAAVSSGKRACSADGAHKAHHIFDRKRVLLHLIAVKLVRLNAPSGGNCVFILRQDKIGGVKPSALIHFDAHRLSGNAESRGASDFCILNAALCIARAAFMLYYSFRGMNQARFRLGIYRISKIGLLYTSAIFTQSDYNSNI